LKARVPVQVQGRQNEVNLQSAPAPAPSVKYKQHENAMILVPMQFYSLDSGQSVAATNADDVFLRPSPGKFPCIQIDIGQQRKLSLLVDTACTAIVLRPSIVAKYGLSTNNAGATMTAAGGGTMSGALTQLERFTLVGSSSSTCDDNEAFGPFPTAVQDIGALPSTLDGIIGLSFLNQFACVDFDFKQGNLVLHKDDHDPSISESAVCLSHNNISLTRMRIWAADMMFDGRGPVKVIVDTGAASTILNWKGITNMGLSRTSDLIARNYGTMGAMGADNVALDLSHRYTLSRRFGLSSKVGTASAGVRIKEGTVPLDVGELPILQALQPEGIGGLLGSDLLMRCDLVRFVFKGRYPSISFFEY